MLCNFFLNKNIKKNSIFSFYIFAIMRITIGSCVHAHVTKSEKKNKTNMSIYILGAFFHNLQLR